METSPCCPSVLQLAAQGQIQAGAMLPETKLRSSSNRCLLLARQDTRQACLPHRLPLLMDWPKRRTAMVWWRGHFSRTQQIWESQYSLRTEKGSRNSRSSSSLSRSSKAEPPSSQSRPAQLRPPAVRYSLLLQLARKGFRIFRSCPTRAPSCCTPWAPTARWAGRPFRFRIPQDHRSRWLRCRLCHSSGRVKEPLQPQESLLTQCRSQASRP